MEKIAIITTCYTGSTIPLARALAKRGYHVDYYILARNICDLEAIPFNYKPAHFGINRIPADSWGKLRDYFGKCSIQLYDIHAPRPFRRVCILGRIMQWFRKLTMLYMGKTMDKKGYAYINIVDRYDNLDFYYLLLKIKQTKVIFSLHEVSNSKMNETSRLPTKLMQYLFDNRLDIVIHSDNALKNIKKYNSFDNRCIHKINFGLFDSYKTIDETEQLNLPSEYILFYGYFLPYKGLDILYNNFAEKNDIGSKIKIVVAGNGNDPYVEEMKKNRRFVCFNKYLSNSEIVTLIKNAKLVICPYKNISQSGIPQTVFVFGKPIIASNLLAFKEVITDKENSILFDLCTDNDLYEKTKELIDNKMLYQTIVDNIAAFSEKHQEFDWDYIASKYLSISIK